jgi:hypothetical protein
MAPRLDLGFFGSFQSVNPLLTQNRYRVPAGVCPPSAKLSGRSIGNPFLFIISSIHFRSLPVRSEGARSSGLYTCSTIVQKSYAFSTDIRSFANRIAINLWVIRTTTNGPAEMTGAYPPVLLPPMRSKRSQGSILSAYSLSRFNLCIMFLIIFNWDNPRMPPPSILRECWQTGVP